MNDFTLNPLFADHMVLQRQQPIRVWGTGLVGKELRISLGQQTSHCQQVTVNHSGHWQALLPPLPAGGPYCLSVKSAHQLVEVHDVLLGDVFLAAGQSNMEWKIGWKINDWQREIDDSHFAQIRFLEVQLNHSAYRCSQIKHHGWRKASPLTAGGFSAVAWFFAKAVHLQQGVAVGVIDSTWGGTPAEAWVSVHRLSQIRGYEKAAQDMLNNASHWQKQLDENRQLEQRKWAMLYDPAAVLKGEQLSADRQPLSEQMIRLPNNATTALHDIVWLKRKVMLDALPQQVWMDIGEVNQVFWLFVNGQLAYEKDWQQMTRPFTLDARLFVLAENQIVLRVVNGWDNQVLVGLPEQFHLYVDEKPIDLSGPWQFSKQIEAAPPAVKHLNWKAGVIFNGMIAPLTPFTFCSVLWYQGESNVDKAPLYGDLFCGLINDWREQFKQSKLPFLFVQISSFGKSLGQVQDSQWARLRAAQTQALSLANTKMAVSLDVGDKGDVHPRNKQAVGHRLYLLAKSLIYRQQVNDSGPVFKSVRAVLHDGRPGLLAEFDHVLDGLQVRGDTLLGFELADDSGRYRPAHAQVLGQSVFVQQPKIKHPRGLRYGWADFSDGNLYNTEELPAQPFMHWLN